MWSNNQHILKPKVIEPDDRAYDALALMQKVRRFGRDPLSYAILGNLAFAIHYVKDKRLQRFFSMFAGKELSQKDKEFILKIMEIDLREMLIAEES